MIRAETGELENAVSAGDPLSLPVLPVKESLGSVSPDWLIERFPQQTGIYRTDRDDEVAMTNGLIRRTWRLQPNTATVGYDNLMTGEAVLRAVDGTWKKTPSMGWMFVPLVEYRGGGAEATIEPLREYLKTYGQILVRNFGSGVQAAYRGYQLCDSDETRAVVKQWVDFYKAHRPILDSDVIHVQRADGRDLDAILHVNPELHEKGFAMIYNPLGTPVRREITPAALLYRDHSYRFRVMVLARGVRFPLDFGELLLYLRLAAFYPYRRFG